MKFMNEDFEEIWLKAITKRIGPFYIQVQDCNDGVDYTIYNYLSPEYDELNEIDGGVIDSCNSISDILEEVFYDENIEEIYLLEDAYLEDDKLFYKKTSRITDSIGGK